jgi:hypothetical protein
LSFISGVPLGVGDLKVNTQEELEFWFCKVMFFFAEDSRLGAA